MNRIILVPRKIRYIIFYLLQQSCINLPLKTTMLAKFNIAPELVFTRNLNYMTPVEAVAALDVPERHDNFVVL